MTSDCPLCRVVADANEPTRIFDFENSVALLNYEQTDYPGFVLLVLREHYEHPHEVPESLMAKYLAERNRLVRAVMKAYPATTRMNYCCMGNSVAHMHDHIVARNPNDPQPGRNPFPLHEEPRLSDDEYRALCARIRAELERD